MTDKQKTISLIISTYNWPEALELTLLSVFTQSLMPSEVIVADDGSTNDTTELIRKMESIFPTKLIHVKHEDKGFRLAAIRNKAICKSSSEYIIQIDGDIILHKHFVKDHMQHAEKKHYITSSRVLINETLTLRSQQERNIKFNWFSKGIRNRLNAMHISFLQKFLTSPTNNIDKAIKKVRGCNMSFWRSDLLEVNGYNEDMTGWGREDSEISVRLVNAGKIKKRIKFGAIQFHQYHKESSRTGLNKNDEILANAVKEKKKECKNGLSNYCKN